MTKTKKLSLILLIAVIAVISGCARNQAKNQVQPGNNKPAEAVNNATSTEPVAVATSTDENIKYLENGEIDTSSWLPLDSEKDSGTKLHFSLIYPNDWLHFGSIDGGQVSNIPFYRKNLYVKKCEVQSNRTEICKEEGKVAEISVRTGSSNLSELGNIGGEKYYIGDNEGFVSTKTLETNTIDPHIFISNKVLQFSLAKIDGMNFTFTMVQENENSKNIFYKVLESIKFR